MVVEPVAPTKAKTVLKSDTEIATKYEQNMIAIVSIVNLSKLILIQPLDI